ncbi:MAG: hypothetical protein KC713_00775 [Candidatus Omnitrophica bacterium]|nr:hypothetical protein [Candidatus Omnitrophota bacterium]
MSKKNYIFNRISHFLILTVLITTQSYAQNGLEVEGIMFEDNPVAIVNGEIVKVGDMIEGVEIIDIGEDFVKFSSNQGGYYISRLGELSQKKNDKVNHNQFLNAQNQTDSGYSKELREKTNDNILNAMDYVTEATNALQSHKIPSIKSYQHALDLYGKAERELQYGLERTLDVEYRNKIKAVLSGIRSDKDLLYLDKMNLEKLIKDAIRNNKLVQGMTKSDVNRSWGRANTVNRSNYSGVRQEQWIYNDEERQREAYLYFDEEILNAIQYR